LNDNEDSFRKFKLIIEETQGKVCLTNFHGMDLTTDKLRSMIKKKQVCILILFYLKNKQNTAKVDFFSIFEILTKNISSRIF
jgi:ribosomal protein S3AE